MATAAVGLAVLGVDLLVWRAAERALPPAPEVQWSDDHRGMSQCLGTTCPGGRWLRAFLERSA